MRIKKKMFMCYAHALFAFVHIVINVNQATYLNNFTHCMILGNRK